MALEGNWPRGRETRCGKTAEGTRHSFRDNFWVLDESPLLILILLFFVAWCAPASTDSRIKWRSLLAGNAFFVEGRGKMTDKVPRPSKSSIFDSNGRWWRRWLLFLSEWIPSWFSRWWRWLPTRDLGWRRSSRLVEDIRQPQSETWLSTLLMWLFEVGTTCFVCAIYDDKVLF